MTTSDVLAAYARVERFDAVGSTNDIVRSWLADGTPEVCVAVADEQLAGRGRSGRSWTAPKGAALLCSVGFRPTWLDAGHAWRLAAIVGLAMADAAEEVAGLGEGTIRFKWPNDLVIVHAGPEALLIGDVPATDARARRSAPLELRKLAGILGESEGLGTADPRLVVGIGINAGWKAADFPAELEIAMTSLLEVSGGRPIDRDDLLDAFLGRLETRLAALRGGRFDVAGWIARQVTTGHLVTLSGLDGSMESIRAVGVDAASGALVVDGVDALGQPADRLVHAGEIVHLRLADPGKV